MENPKRAGHANGYRLTRKRVPLSCTACRVRKLKCNREKPCQNCVVRGESTTSCSYAERVEKKNGLSNSRSEAEVMRQRLNRLENSILSMMSEKSSRERSLSNAPSTSPHPSQGSEERHSDTSQHAGTHSVSLDTRSTHWDAILNEIGEMKDTWSEQNDSIEFLSSMEQPETGKPHRPTLLSGLSVPPERKAIIASLPDRLTTEMLVLQFFDSYTPLAPARYLIHRPTFMKQLERHFDDPTATPIAWIGLLFGALTIGMHSFRRTNTPPPDVDTAPAMAELYRIRTAQCIQLADMTKPCNSMIEALTFYSFIEYAEERDGDMGTCVLSGTMMRLALQQGYHRDPSNHPGLTVFQGEMRRRIWAAICQHELLFSVQLGLPRAIRYAETDTKRISNLHDWELYEEMTELPPPRPLTDETEICYQVVKGRVLIAYGHVVEFLHILEPQPYSAVLKLDLMLIEARDAIPPHLQLGTLEEMKNDPPWKVLERYLLILFWHKAVCILHKKYWDAPPINGFNIDFSYSRRCSVVSSMALLELQEAMHKAAQPGGLLEASKWWEYSLTNHDFLVAAMVISLDIMQKTSNDNNLPTLSNYCVDASQKLNLVIRSRAIWAEVVEKSKDAKRAVSVLTAVIHKCVAKLGEDRKEGQPRSHPALSASASNTDVDSLRQKLDCTGLVSNLLPPIIPDEPRFEDTLMQDEFLNSAAMDLPADFSWDSFDQFMYPQTQFAPGQVEMPFAQQLGGGDLIPQYY